MHNGKVHNTGGPQATGLERGTIEVFSLNNHHDHDGNHRHDVIMPRSRTIAYFINGSDDITYKRNQTRLKPGQLVSFDLVSRADCLIAINIRYESRFHWEHLNPFRGYLKLILLAVIASTIILFGYAHILKFIEISSSPVVPSLIDVAFTGASVISKILYSIFIGIVCQFWLAARWFKSGLFTGLKLGLLIGLVVLVPQCLENTKMDIWNLLADLLKYSLTTGIVSSVSGGILGTPFNRDLSHLRSTIPD